MQESGSSVSLAELMEAYMTFNKKEEVQCEIAKEKLGQLFTRLFDHPDFKQHQAGKVCTYKYQGYSINNKQPRNIIDDISQFQLPGNMACWQDHEFFIVHATTFYMVDGKDFDIVFGVNTETNFVNVSVGDKFLKPLTKYGIHFSGFKDQVHRLYF